MTKIFIDVGAHNGETLHVALNPIFGFSKIYALEPSKSCIEYLRTFKDPRIEILPFGLSNKSGRSVLHGSGLLGATLYSDKRQVTYDSALLIKEDISLIQATDFIKSIFKENSKLYLKLNCEGSECDILEDLIFSNAIGRITSIYVDFDIRKIASQSYRQLPIENQLKALNIKYHTPDSLSKKGDEAVNMWLTSDCPLISPPFSSRLKFFFASYAPFNERVRLILESTLPRKFYLWLGHKIGRQARKKLFKSPS